MPILVDRFIDQGFAPQGDAPYLISSTVNPQGPRGAA